MNLNINAEIISGKKDVFTHLVVAAHQDDIEIMCGDGIVQCYQKADRGLVAVIVSDGAGSPRNGKFTEYTNKQMIALRRQEQINAAKEGDYATLILLNYQSKDIADTNKQLVEDLRQIISKYTPKIIYSHNPADKHKTHIRVLESTLKALRAVPSASRPKLFYGCECWRNLDWLNDEDKVVFDLSGYGDLLTKLLAMHESQIGGGKRYDLAAHGRYLANATFFCSHQVDSLELASFGMDLTPLIMADTLDLRQFTIEKIEDFKSSLRL